MCIDRAFSKYRQACACASAKVIAGSLDITIRQPDAKTAFFKAVQEASSSKDDP